MSYFDNNDFPIKSWRMVELVQQVQYGADFNTLKLWLDTYDAVDEYYLALHNKDEKDGVPVEPHIHCFVKFKGARNTQTVLNSVNNAFGDSLEKPVYSFQHMSKVKNGWPSAVAYGSHMNAPEKYPYYSDKDFVFATNIVNVEDLVGQGVAPIKNKRLREIESFIQKGLVNRQNLYVNRYLTSADFLNHERKIDVLLDFYQNRNAKLDTLVGDVVRAYDSVLSAYERCMEYVDQIKAVDEELLEDGGNAYTLRSTRSKFISKLSDHCRRFHHSIGLYNSAIEALNVVDKSVFMASKYADFEIPVVSDEIIDGIENIMFKSELK